MRILAMLPLLMLAVPVAGAEPKRIVAVFAHPDDEVVVAPALAAAAGGGAHVRIVYATAGDAAAPETDLAPGAAIAARRTAEAKCAARALGAREPFMLGIGDGTLGAVTRPPGDGLAWLGAAIAEIMKDERPDIVITWGPDGGYGHPDHRLVSAVVTELIAGRADRPLLLHAAIPVEQKPPVPEMNAWATIASDLVTTRVAYTPADLAAASQAVQCHASQFSPLVRAGLVPLFAGSVWKGGVAFRAPLDAARGDSLLTLRR